MANDLSTLNAKQKEAYNTYIANDVDSNDAYGLVTGTLSKEDYFQKLDNQVTPKTQKEFLTQEGYDYDLIQSTGKKIKDRSANYYKYGMIDTPDDIYQYNAPTEEEIYNFAGIRTDPDKEAPGSIRMALSYALPGDANKISEGKKLFAQYLVNEKGLKPELVEKYKDKIELKYQSVGKGLEQYNALTYKIPKELGGDGLYYAYNSPKVYPTTGDWKAITGDAIPVAFAVTGGTIGSAAGPVGTVGGSALMTYAGELTKLYIGRKVYGLHSDLSDDQFWEKANESAMLSGAIDLALTPAALGLGQVIKKMIMTAPADKLSKDTIKKFVKAGGNLDSEMTKALDDARQVLLKNGVDPKVADDYLAISLANALPDAGIFATAGAESKYLKVLNEANKRVQASGVERKVIKKLTGLDQINTKEADSILDTVAERVKSIREKEILDTNKSVQAAYVDLNKTQKSFLKDPTSSAIDDMGITFSEINQKISKQIPYLENQINKSAKNNRLEVVIDDAESVKVLNTIIGDLKGLKNIKAPKALPKDATAEEVKLYNKQKAQSNFKNLLDSFGNSEALANQVGIIKKGLQNLDKMTFQEAVTWRAFLRNAEQATEGTLSNAIRKVKGTFNTAIDRATEGNPQTRQLIDSYDDLLFNYRNSFLENLSKQFGYGNSSQVIKPYQLTGNSRNAFQAFTNNTTEGLNNAEKLGNLINLKGNNKVMTENQINRIKSALYENYYDKVMPKAAGEAQGQMTHKDFVKQFGDNYKLILGPDEYNKFAKSNEAALNTYQSWITKQAKIQNVLSEKLPTLDIEVIKSGSPSAIVNEIFRKGSTQDIKGLVTSLEKIDPGLITDIRRLYLQKFLKDTSTGVNTKTLLWGKGMEVRGMNGKVLDEYLTNNSSTVKQLFSEEFFNAHRDIAKALKLIQEEAPVIGKGGLTEVANKAGLFVDIFAGPLNHKRLIINRMGRIYDGFDLGGDSLALLRDYDRFIQAAKKNYMGGNYPVIFDKLSKEGGSANKTLYQKFLKSINFDDMGPTNKWYLPDPRNPYKLLDIKSNPLYAKEYIKEKIEGKSLSNQPTVFTPADEAINLVLGGPIGPGGRGPTIPKYLHEFLSPQLEKLYNMIVKGKKSRKLTIEEKEKQEFEKKLAK